MILVTKDIFLDVKKIVDIHVNANILTNIINDKVVETPQYRIDIWADAILAGSAQQYSMNTYFASKEEAYACYRELIRQIIDSGEYPEMNNKLLDNVLTTKEETK
jgi:hypothetical protein